MIQFHRLDLIISDILWCTSVMEYVANMCSFNFQFIRPDSWFKSSFKKGMSSALFDIEQITQDQAGL